MDGFFIIRVESFVDFIDYFVVLRNSINKVMVVGLLFEDVIIWKFDVFYFLCWIYFFDFE